MKGAQSIATRRAYGVQRICRVWGRARSSVYARRHATRARASRRRGLVGHIRRVLEASPFHGEGYRKAWAKLRVAGIRTSKERVRRLMREHDLQAPHRVGHAHGPKAHDGTITTEAPDAMWGTDMTATVTIGEGSAFVFVAVDHCTTECIGQPSRPRAGAGSRPWSRSVRGVPSNASAPLAKAWPMGCVSVTTTGELSGRRFSTGGRVLRHRKLPRASCGTRRQPRR